MKNAIRLNSILCYEVMLEKENASDTVCESKKGIIKWLEKASDVKLKDKRISLDNYAKLLHLNRLAHSINMRTNGKESDVIC